MVARNTHAHEVSRHCVPSNDDVQRIFLIRKQTEALLETIADVCPAGPDRSAAFRKVREGMMTAIASIVVNQGNVANLNQQQPTWDPEVDGDTPGRFGAPD